MKRLFSLLLAGILLAQGLGTVSLAQVPEDILSEAYIVMDARSGQVLAQRNMDQRMFPASTTKILTCALALQRGNPSDVTTMSYDAVHSIGRDTTHIALTEGERVSVGELLGATMVESANDAANGLAEYISGSLEQFAALMNETALAAGAYNTHFTNAHGLPDDDHYTTAYDMAIITRYALGVEGFRELFGALECVVSPTNKQSNVRRFGTHHHMLVQSAYTYAGATGGKLGWTSEARHTLVTLAERNGVELICVVLKSDDPYQKYRDTAALFDYCFDNYRSATFQAAYFTHDPIPLMEDGVQVGSVVLSPRDLTISRPAQLAKADIHVELRVPERYDGAGSVWPAARFLDRQGNLLCEIALDYTLSDPVTLPANAANAPTPDDGRIPFAVFLLFGAAALSLAVAILFAIRARNIHRQNLRARQRAMQRATRRTVPSAERTTPSKKPPPRRPDGVHPSGDREPEQTHYAYYRNIQ